MSKQNSSSVPWLTQSLNFAGSHYQETQHPKAFTAQEVAEKEHVSGHQVAKTVAVKIDNRTILLVLPASRRVALDRIREIAGAKFVRLLSEIEIKHEFPDCELGSIPPLRHWSGIDLWMDGTLSSEKEILIEGGTNESAVRIPFSEWHELAKPREEFFSQPSDWGPGLVFEKGQ